jgi:hypothetical protein
VLIDRTTGIGTMLGLVEATGVCDLDLGEEVGTLWALDADTNRAWLIDRDTGVTVR